MKHLIALLLILIGLPIDLFSCCRRLRGPKRSAPIHIEDNSDTNATHEGESALKQASEVAAVGTSTGALVYTSAWMTDRSALRKNLLAPSPNVAARIWQRRIGITAKPATNPAKLLLSALQTYSHHETLSPALQEAISILTDLPTPHFFMSFDRKDIPTELLAHPWVTNKTTIMTCVKVSLPPRFAHTFTKLQILSCRGCRLLTNLSALTQLRKLYLGNIETKLETRHLPASLIKLELRYCDLDRIPGLRHLKKLQKLDLRDNPNITFDKDLLPASLIKLNLGGCRWDESRAAALRAEYPHLEEVLF